MMPVLCIQIVKIVEYYLKTSTGDIVCPYDKTHVLREERLSRHVIKCAKNVATSKNLTSCEFNYCHKIKRGDVAEHYSRCAHKEIENEWLRNGKFVIKGVLLSFPNIMKFILMERIGMRNRNFLYWKVFWTDSGNTEKICHIHLIEFILLVLLCK